MSELAIGASGGGSSRSAGSVLSPLTVALMLVIGIVGFAGSLLLGAYAPDLRSGRNGGTHALSNAATGFAGIVDLARATGRNPRLIRAEGEWRTEDLVVATPEHGTVDMSRLMAARRGRATLIVLPKWATTPDRDVAGWVDVVGLLPASDPAGTLAPATPMVVTRHPSGGRPLHAVRWAPASLSVAAPRPLQVVRSPALTPLVTDDAGGIVLGQIGQSPVYILSDPDLLDNNGIRRLERARAGLDLLDFVNSTGATGIAFDVTLNGLGRGRSPLKLAFEPPFLAMTLASVVALALVGWQALIRFGPVQPPARAIAFGKTALIDNSATIVRKAGHEGGLGPRYAALLRERARAIFGVPPGLSDAEADAYLDRLQGSTRFTTLVADAIAAEHAADMLASAQALHQWQQEKTR
ncbi:hypothetical protein [Sphingomonas sp. RIT328]|uniref:hypothetical protein n=1 Tax=Sphingomonas sp. RIT328 TaxID=1470591 RepID=UPI00044FE945|nr:hypothetical protein [Sphingomonas sp. RIT328]EZP50055.1 hypothetical protein BW41_03380 [Sphingomonas sp. RIT328]